MSANDLAVKVVNQMYEKDRLSQWLGIELIEIEKGKSVIKMEIREEMLNGFDVIHGGITFSLADSAFAFAANSHGRVSMATPSLCSA